MVSTRRTKRPSFGDAAAAPLAPATPATARGKRARTAAATPATAASATSARGRQQRGAGGTGRGRGRGRGASSSAAQDSGEERESEAADDGSAVTAVEEEQIASNAATAQADEADNAGAAEHATTAAPTKLVNEVEAEAATQAAADASDDEAEAEEDVEDDAELELAEEPRQPRVRTAATREDVVGDDGDERQDGGADGDDDDGVDDDDEYNFDVDNEPLAPPTAAHCVDGDDDDDNLRAKEIRQRASVAVDEDDDEGGDTAGATTKFGATLSALLHQPTAPQVSPLLAAAPLLPIPRDPTAAADRALRLKQRARREWRERAHRSDVQYDDVERRLVRVATRGVVQLFNAVQQQRRAGRMQAAAEEKDRAEIAGSSKQAELSKEGFMQLIRTAPRVERAEEQKATGREGGATKARGEDKGAGWSVLKDDYILGGKLTDWDKQADESEQEDELEGEQEMEVE